MSIDKSELPSKKQFEELEKAISAVFEESERYKIPYNKTTNIGKILKDGFTEMVNFRKESIDKINGLSAYQWILANEIEKNIPVEGFKYRTKTHKINSFEEALSCIDKQVKHGKNFIDYHAKKAVAYTGRRIYKYAKAPSSIDFPSVKRKKVRLRTEEMLEKDISFFKKHPDFMRKLEIYSNSFHDSIWVRERAIFIIATCLKEFHYSGEYLKTEVEIAKIIKSSIKELESAKKTCIRLSSYEDLSFIGNRFAVHYIDRAMNILNSDIRPEYYISRKSKDCKYHRLVITVTRYFLINGGIAISKSDFSPVAVLVQNNQIKTFVMTCQSQLEEIKKLEPPQEVMSELEEWQDEDGSFLPANNRNQCKYEVNNIVGFLDNVFQFKGFEDDYDDREKNKAIIENEVCKYAIEVELSRMATKQANAKWGTRVEKALLEENGNTSKCKEQKREIPNEAAILVII